MKSTDLATGFTFDERTVLFKEGVLHVPDHYDNYDQFGTTIPELFPKKQPLFVEICSGNGHWVCEQALAHPEHNFVAVEKRFERVRKIWMKKQAHSLSNLIIVCGKAELTLKHFFQPASVEHLYIHFPDPWPKRRHHKHRLLKPAMLADLERVLCSKGQITLVTDHLPYGLEILGNIQKSPSFSPVFEEPHYKTCLSYGNSTFEKLWKSMGRDVYHFLFELLC